MAHKYKDYQFAIYIVGNFQKTTFYIGFTNNLVKRTIEHKYGIGSNFTSKYKLTELVYYEFYQYAPDAISREKELKKWRREKNIKLIKTMNPEMKDLSEKIFKDYDIKKDEIEEYVKQFKNLLKISPPRQARGRNDKNVYD